MGNDAAARARALDVRRSFIVHAPAGSGKTELLIQRYLALLATVRYPEQIVAITFTRKAASEMRSRVLNALDLAQARDPDVQTHQLKTLDLARAALAADRHWKWELQTQPERLRISTIDAFNAWLARERPFDSAGVAEARVAADPRQFYSAAARRLLRAVEETGVEARALRRIMQIWGNDLGRLEGLLSELLPKREQWLRHLAPHSGRALRTFLEDALARNIESAQGALLEWLGPACCAELEGLLRHAAEHAASDKNRARFRPWQEQSAKLVASSAQLEAWQSLTTLLLTEQGAWRKQLGEKLGFSAAHAGPRVRLRAVIEALARQDGLANELQRLVVLPPPGYSDQQWRILEAFRSVLLRLAAELSVVFTEHRVVDFVEIALAAQRALGATDQPSELLLALDQRIEHLLVDEYQDTSHMQHQLLSLLTAGWENGDGRSLFLVGDPMQSIYRFRDADVSLFLNAERFSFGQVRCERLRLTDNFRSAPVLVNWVNRVFGHAPAPRIDSVKGGVAFEPCSSRRESRAQQYVRLHALRDRAADAEIERASAIVDEELARDPDQSLAILVQSRTHLQGLGERLSSAGHHAETVEVDQLDRTQIGQDLIALTRALLHMGDRLAWLAVLRAPWCGLLWADLEAVARLGAGCTVWESIQDEQRLRVLSSDGRARVRAFRAHIQRALYKRDDETLATWVRQTWIGLGGPECLVRGEQIHWAEAFFQRLGAVAEGEDLDDPARLGQVVAQAQFADDAATPRGVQIMTIHRAKGLEFDTVVMLGLGREPRREPARALYWQETVDSNGRRDLLLGAPVPLGQSASPVTAYLRTLEQENDKAEQTRLLYVGATRARERLHLIARIDTAATRPAPRSLLGQIWSEFEPLLGPPSASGPGAWEARSFSVPLRRLREVRVVSVPGPVSSGDDVRPEFIWAGSVAAHVGTVVHRELRLLADRAEPGIGCREVRDCSRFRRQLALLGVEEFRLDEAAQRVADALLAVLEDPCGRWILAPHEDAGSEIVLNVMGPGGPEQMRLDRTFLDNGRRWIIDYKVGVHEGGDLAAYLDREVERYSPQLERYAAAMRRIETESIETGPIELGLYFPLIRQFRSWTAQS